MQPGSHSTRLVAVVGVLAAIAIVLIATNAQTLQTTTGGKAVLAEFGSTPAACVPDGGQDDILSATDCCSGSAVSGSILCGNASDLYTSWLSCTQMCGTTDVTAPSCPYGPTGTPWCPCPSGTTWNGQYQPGSCQNQTQDTTPPTINYAGASANNSNNVSIYYGLSELAYVTVQYGTSSYTDSAGPSGLQYSGEITLPPLVPGTLYRYRIIAQDVAGNAGVSSEYTFSTPAETDTIPPSEPGTPVASAVTTNSATLTWSAATDASGIARYRVWRDGTNIAEVTSTTYSATDLLPATTYSFSISAVDNNGNEGTRSGTRTVTTSTAQDTTAPTTPGTPVASAVTTNSATLTWSASSDASGIARYRVWVNSINWLNTTNTTTTLTTLNPSTTYAVTISAVDNNGNEGTRSAQRTVTTLTPADTTPPSVPGTPVASAITTTTATLSWSASSDVSGIARYRIFQNNVNTANSTSNFATFTSLTPSTQYQFSVSAVDNAGNEGTRSAQSTVTTLVATDTTPPTTPGTPVASAVTTNSATLTWSAATDASGIARYRIWQNNVNAADSTSNFATITGLTPSTQYQFSVSAVDNNGNEGTRSGTTTVTTINVPAVCGNGIREGTESCDNGSNNGACPAGCSSTCNINNCAPSDVSPPQITSGSPAGTLARSVKAVTLVVTTNEAAVCKYSTSSTATYDQMTNTMTASGNTHTSTGILVRSNVNYNYYVRCVDSAGNRNTESYQIAFRVRGLLW